MKRLGIDLGTSSIKLVLMENDKIINKIREPHYGNVLKILKSNLMSFGSDEDVLVSICGANKNLLKERIFIDEVEDIPAIVKGSNYIDKRALSIIEIGSQSARYITDLNTLAPTFSINEHCAGGTGSFFEDQMSRLNLKIEDYSNIIKEAKSIPNLSGRCAVFAKTDIIHRQQEGIPTPDILLGLCYAMIRNYKAQIVKTLPILKPIIFCGGVTLNKGVLKAIKHVFKLEDNELIVSENSVYASAIGAALLSKNKVNIKELISSLDKKENNYVDKLKLPKLVLEYNVKLVNPTMTNKMPKEGAYLGVDVGSTSTNLVLISKENELINYQYLRTKGNPLGVVRYGLNNLKQQFGEFNILGVGITGSGRERIGKMMGADSIKDEITAQAKAASFFVSDCDTVFEIGGQDSKYISIKNKEVIDFQMNKICAAGTGSFIEEIASRMNIAIENFGPLALKSESPCDLGERCTVFISTSIAEAESKGAKQEDIAAGLCHSIVKNYLHKVVENKKVGNKIVLQGGVDYNPGIVAAFQSVYHDKITVSPVFPISGAFGVALLCKEELKDKSSSFLGFDFKVNENKEKELSEEIKRNKKEYKRAGKLATIGYDGKIDPNKKTVGVPLSLVMFKFFPLANAFFKHLGFNVILSNPSNLDTVYLAQENAHGETCYPVKLIYGHMLELANKKVDYIFLPKIHTIRHIHSHAKHNYACPYMQMASEIVFKDLGLEKRGIKLLSPVMDIDNGAKMMAKAMLDIAKDLGFSRLRAIPGLIKGAKAVVKFSSGVEKLGKEVLDNIKPDEKVLVLMTRNYNISDPILNMGIPDLLLERGYKVLTLGHLPAHSLDICKDYPNMYWPFGDHLLSGTKIIKNHPNLYAVYLVNHGCGPDTMISHLIKEEMGDKPYLQIEVDEHFSKVGVITRIEAFLNSLNHQEQCVKKDNFDILDVNFKDANIVSVPFKSKKLLIPNMGLYTGFIIDYFNKLGYNCQAMPEFNRETLSIGRSEMSSKEYLPIAMLVGACIRAIKENKDDNLQFLVPFNYGADADGQYARVISSILDSLGYKNANVVSPIVEEEYEKSLNKDLLLRAILAGDIIYNLDKKEREQIDLNIIPSEEELLNICKKFKTSDEKKTLGIVGDFLCLTSLNEGIIDKLENKYRILRMPLSEMLYFLYKDNGHKIDTSLIDKVKNALGTNSSFSNDFDELFTIADKSLDRFAGNNSRYRFAKAIDISKKVDSVLLTNPRYENSSMVMNLTGVSKLTHKPLFELQLDGDWDENSAARLNSFLYYCDK